MDACRVCVLVTEGSRPSSASCVGFFTDKSLVYSVIAYSPGVVVSGGSGTKSQGVWLSVKLGLIIASLNSIFRLMLFRLSETVSVL